MQPQVQPSHEYINSQQDIPQHPQEMKSLAKHICFVLEEKDWHECQFMNKSKSNEFFTDNYSTKRLVSIQEYNPLLILDIPPNENGILLPLMDSIWREKG